MNRLIVAIVFTGIALQGPDRPALAQRYVPRALKRKARRLQRKAIWAYRRHKYQKAVDYFHKAYKAWPRRELHFNIALCYGRLGDKIKAATYLRKFIKDASAREMRSIPKWLKEILEEVAVVNIQGPIGATVTMDGKEVGKVPVELIILPGMHLFVVTKANGKRVAKRDWDVPPGLRKVWEVVEAKPRPRPRLRPRPPVRPIIVVRAPLPPPPKPKPIPRALTITAAVLAVALAGGAVGTGLKARSLHDDYKANPTRDTRDQGILMVNLTNGLWGAAGGVALTAAILAIFTQWARVTERPKAPRLGVGAAPGGASVTVTGRF